MRYEPPSSFRVLEYIGGEHAGTRDAIITALQNILLDNNDGEIAVGYDQGVAKLELHLEHVFENPLPARHDRPPSDEPAPSRMYTDNPRVTPPHFPHLLGVEALEGAIKTAVRVKNG